MIKIRKRNGMALLTIIMFSTMMIIMTGVIFLRISHASKEISRRDMIDRTNSMTDAVLSNLINWLNNENWDENETNKLLKNTNIEAHGMAFLADFYSPDPYKKGIMDVTGANSSTSYTPDIKIESSIPHIPLDLQDSYSSPVKWEKNKFLTNFITGTNSIDIILSTISSPSTGIGGVYKGLIETGANLGDIENWDPHKLADNLYRKFEIKTKNPQKQLIKQEVRVSIIPITTNVNNGINEFELHGCDSTGASCDRDEVIDHIDIFKIFSKTCVPDCDNPNYTRNHELIIQRPVATKLDLNLDHAVLADGSIDIKNADTNSGVTYLDSTNEGDVHSNDSISIGPKGNIGGKVTSAGYVYFGSPADLDSIDPEASNVVPTYGIHEDHPLYSSDQIYDKENSKSKVAKIDIPTLEFGEMPTIPCDTNAAILKDCRITGSYNQTKDQKFEGTVYITGNYTQKGDFQAIGEEPVRIIVEGVINIGGNAKATTVGNQEVMFVSHSAAQPAIKIAGNPGTGVDNGALFYTSNPESTVQVRGTADVFGAILAEGGVEFDGNMTMKRDTDMEAIKRSFPPVADQVKMQIVSWKELKDN